MPAAQPVTASDSALPSRMFVIRTWAEARLALSDIGDHGTGG